MNRYQTTQHDSHKSRLHLFRLSLLATFILMLSFGLVLRLAHLQFSGYKRYATLSLKNQMSLIPIPPTRGIILDRNGKVLAQNMPVYVLEIIPERAKNLNKTLQELKQLIPSITEEDLDHFMRARRQTQPFMSIPLKLKLTQEEVALFANNQYLFPGVTIKARLLRHYPLGEATAHLLGYVGRINEQELKRVHDANYRATNFIGKTGFERYYEAELHGKVGYQQVETDASGRTVRTISKQSPASGAKIYLTIDADLQQVAHDALKGKRGAVVILDTTNGDILAMASAPSYDPNLFVNGISKQTYRQLANADDKPLFNRAVRGLYPPASTIKPFIALAGLDKEIITPKLKVFDPGWYRLPGIAHQYRDWKRRGHGVVDLKRALTVSCDTYFYQLGNKLGISTIEDTLMQFGFGSLSHVDLVEEAAGIVPGPGWKRRSKGVSWYPGDTLITAIGQGFMLASPLQMANATAALAEHGRRFRPHLFAKSVQDSTNETHLYRPLEEYPIHLKDESYWQIIADAMKNVVTSREGTGHRFGRNTRYSIAAKTGTAQVFSGDQYEKKRYLDIPEALRDHSLFIAYAPVETPEIAIAVMIENDFVAPTVARKAVDAYFDLKERKLSS